MIETLAEFRSREMSTSTAEVRFEALSIISLQAFNTRVTVLNFVLATKISKFNICLKRASSQHLKVCVLSTGAQNANSKHELE